MSYAGTPTSPSDIPAEFLVIRAGCAGDIIIFFFARSGRNATTPTHTAWGPVVSGHHRDPDPGLVRLTWTLAAIFYKPPGKQRRVELSHSHGGIRLRAGGSAISSVPQPQ